MIIGLGENNFILPTSLVSPFIVPVLQITKLLRKLHFLNCSIAPFSFLSHQIFSLSMLGGRQFLQEVVCVCPALQSQSLVSTGISSKAHTGTEQTWVPHPSKSITGARCHLEPASIGSLSLCPAWPRSQGSAGLVLAALAALAIAGAPTMAVWGYKGLLCPAGGTCWLPWGPGGFAIASPHRAWCGHTEEQGCRVWGRVPAHASMAGVISAWCL